MAVLKRLSEVRGIQATAEENPRRLEDHAARPGFRSGLQTLSTPHGPEQNESGVRPFVTVVLPIRNEAGYIAHSLGALLRQDYPADRLEILVVDGMSNDATRDVIR